MGKSIKKRDAIVYVDDCLIFGERNEDVERICKRIGEKFNVTDKGMMIQKYLGIQISHNANGSFKMYQAFLIERIISIT